jgi:hypothetical protein
MRYLDDTDRRALRLADNLQKAMQRWLSNRGVDQSCTVSPFVDPSGQPAVVIKMNAQVAMVMADSLNEQHRHASQRPPPEGAP